MLVKLSIGQWHFCGWGNSTDIFFPQENCSLQYYLEFQCNISKHHTLSRCFTIHVPDGVSEAITLYVHDFYRICRRHDLICNVFIYHLHSFSYSFKNKFSITFASPVFGSYKFSTKWLWSLFSVGLTLELTIK